MSSFLHHWLLRASCWPCGWGGGGGGRPLETCRSCRQGRGRPEGAAEPRAGSWELGTGCRQDEAAGLGAAPPPPPPRAHGRAATCPGGSGAQELRGAAAAMLGLGPGFWEQDWTLWLWKVG